MSIAFRGWRRLKAQELLRATDRWTFAPEKYESPAQMLSIAHTYQEFCDVGAWRRLALRVRSLGSGYNVYRRTIARVCARKNSRKKR